ncbi:hypothetical protein [Nocardiopsis sp. LOL_012]|uniref:hypothetical protein n=1 Tax=Nocardiopsis sp. LOL_012 TaxID=3345409 RepID=UPI003A852518
MEFTTFSIEACAPAADGGVVPGLVPVPTLDPDALEEAAGNLRTVGAAIEEYGSDISSAWASLTGIYAAPESDRPGCGHRPLPGRGAGVSVRQ